MRYTPDLKRDKRIRVVETGPDGCMGFIQIGHSLLKFIASWGGGWDHVSVSRDDRCPRWEEMDAVKRAFFLPDEVAYQLHPREDRHISIHENCLHLWRPQEREIPLPPLVMV